MFKNHGRANYLENIRDKVTASLILSTPYLQIYVGDEVTMKDGTEGSVIAVQKVGSRYYILVAPTELI